MWGFTLSVLETTQNHHHHPLFRHSPLIADHLDFHISLLFYILILPNLSDPQH